MFLGGKIIIKLLLIVTVVDLSSLYLKEKQ